VIYRFCTELLEDHFVSDATFAEAHDLFDSQALVDIIGTLGNYSMLAFCLNAFQVDLQPDREPPYPDIRGYAHVAPVASA
jgi:4-carboxymuconolactone decarboxylase